MDHYVRKCLNVSFKKLQKFKNTSIEMFQKITIIYLIEIICQVENQCDENKFESYVPK